MTDRRIRKTEQALQHAFTELIREKELPQITIKELCEKADINKSTFYLHYRDIYDLASSMKRQFLNDCYRIITQYDVLEFSANSTEIWTEILKLFHEKNNVYIAFINSSSVFALAPTLEEGILAPLMEKAKNDHPELSLESLQKLQIAITFITSGSIGLLQSIDFQNLPDAIEFISTQLQSGFGITGENTTLLLRSHRKTL